MLHLHNLHLAKELQAIEILIKLSFQQKGLSALLLKTKGKKVANFQIIILRVC
jgi:hypothetical protein